MNQSNQEFNIKHLTLFCFCLYWGLLIISKTDLSAVVYVKAYVRRC